MDIGQTVLAWTPVTVLAIVLFVVVGFVVRLLQRTPR